MLGKTTLLLPEIAERMVTSSGADFVFIPEKPPTADSWEDEMCDIIKAVCAVNQRLCSCSRISLPSPHSIELLESVKQL